MKSEPIADLIMPWPPSTLNPNARVHHMAAATAKRSLRDAWAWTAKSQGAKKIDAEALHLSLTFVPPDRRRRDLDNCLASCKAGLDGLADVLGVDDRHWRLSLAMEPGPGGFVRVEVTRC